MDHANAQHSNTSRNRAHGVYDMDRQRDVIEKLYWDEDVDLEHVREMMEIHYNFKATARQYKDAFKRWGLQKNITGDEMKHMIRIRKRRLSDKGKATEFHLRERRVRDDKIARWDQRKGFSTQTNKSGMPPMPPTPPTIKYNTPSEVNSPPALPEPPNNLSPRLTDAGRHGMVDSARDSRCYFTSHDDDDGQVRSYPDVLDSFEQWTHPKELPFSPKTYHQTDSGESLAGTSGDDDTSQYQIIPDISLSSLSRIASIEESGLEESSQAGYTQKSNSSGAPTIDIPSHDQDHPHPTTAELSHEDELLRSLTSLINYDELPDVPQIVSRACSRSTTICADLNEAIHASGMPSSKDVPAREACGSTETSFIISEDNRFRSLLKHQAAQKALRLAMLNSDWRALEIILDSGDDPLCLRDLESSHGLEAFNTLKSAIEKDQPIAVNALFSRVLAAIGESPMSATVQRLISDVIQIALDIERCECLRILTNYCCLRKDFSWKSTIYLVTVDSRLDAMRMLFEHHIDLEIPITLRHCYPLHVTVCWPTRDSLAMCRLLLQNGAQVDPKDRDGVTPLHMAARESSQEVDFATLLLEYGADVNAQTVSGATPLQKAVTNGSRLDRHVVTTLVAWGACLNAQDIRGRTPLHSITYSGRWYRVDTIDLSKRSSIIDSLINAGANPNMQDHYGQTPLNFLMACSKHPVFARAVAASLIQAGADVSIQDREGKTPLHYAVARFGDKDLMQVLLDAGADPNVQDQEGQTSLHVMIESKRVRRSRVALLLAHGAQPDIFNRREETVIDVAIRRYHDIPMKAFALLLTENLV